MIPQFIGQILKPVFQVRDKSVDYVELMFESTELIKQGFTYFSQKKKKKVKYDGGNQGKTVSLLNDFSDPSLR